MCGHTHRRPAAQELFQQVEVGLADGRRAVVGDPVRLAVRALDQPHSGDAFVDQGLRVVGRATQVSLQRHCRPLRPCGRRAVEVERSVDGLSAFHVDLDPDAVSSSRLDDLQQPALCGRVRDLEAEQCRFYRHPQVKLGLLADRGQQRAVLTDRVLRP